MNPKDIMTDAIHNFHPQYQQYTQYSSGEFSIFSNSFFCMTLLEIFWLLLHVKAHSFAARVFILLTQKNIYNTINA